MIRRGFVIVSGAPGAGKSTLAGPLAERLGLPLIGKDHIKETLFDHLPEGPDRAVWSKILGAASFEVVWTLASHAPAAVPLGVDALDPDARRRDVGRIVDIRVRVHRESAA